MLRSVINFKCIHCAGSLNEPLCEASIRVFYTVHTMLPTYKGWANAQRRSTVYFQSKVHSHGYKYTHCSVSVFIRVYSYTCILCFTHWTSLLCEAVYVCYYIHAMRSTYKGLGQCTASFNCTHSNKSVYVFTFIRAKYIHCATRSVNLLTHMLVHTLNVCIYLHTGTLRTTHITNIQ